LNGEINNIKASTVLKANLTTASIALDFVLQVRKSYNLYVFKVNNANYPIVKMGRVLRHPV